MKRIVVKFSCGAASAVAAKVTIGRYATEADVHVVYLDLSRDEHPDNERFMADVEKWIGQPVIRLRGKYKSVDDVYLNERYAVSIYGASCTRAMKRAVGDAYERPGDYNVLGYTADEPDRIARFIKRNPDKKCLWVLAAAGITKEDCYHILSAHGIELPAMYKMGYEHNNCIGCVKGGKGYWNKIRRDFPDVFSRKAKILREIGCQLHSGGKLYWLDELKPDEGNDVPEPNIECGVFCEGYRDVLDVTINSQPRVFASTQMEIEP